VEVECVEAAGKVGNGRRGASVRRGLALGGLGAGSGIGGPRAAGREGAEGCPNRQEKGCGQTEGQVCGM
jgi:hypothetical protein